MERLYRALATPAQSTIGRPPCSCGCIGDAVVASGMPLQHQSCKIAAPGPPVSYIDTRSASSGIHRHAASSNLSKTHQTFPTRERQDSPNRPGPRKMLTGRKLRLPTFQESFSIGLAFWTIVAYYVCLGGLSRPSGLPGI